MLKVGKIKNYHQERGFGFIEVEDEKRDLFFHIKDFPKGSMPKIGERLTFNILQDGNKLKAVNIIRLDVYRKYTTPSKQRLNSSKQNENKSINFLSIIITLICIVGIGTFSYQYIKDKFQRHELAAELITPQTNRIANENAKRKPAEHHFYCDGRIHCSEMNSRAEANWFVANCPGTKMDGDNDGQACENDSRW